jgi:hypothetical protein
VGHASVFGLDDLTLSLEGSCKGTTFSCWGFAAEAPDLPFRATLLFSSSDDEAPSPSLRPLPRFDPHRLPKPLSR